MGRLVAKGLLFAATLAGLLMSLEALVTSLTPWRGYEDPRTRILWDGAFDGTPVVLLGGSEFASMYVDTLSDTLWARLEAYTGQGVFPGALNGARLADVLAATIHVSREWPRGTTVLISLVPTRFVPTRAEEPPRGNFADDFLRRYGIDASGDGAHRHLRAHVYRSIHPFSSLRTRSALAHFVDRPQPPRWQRNRTWTDDGEVAMGRYELFERQLIMGAGPRPLTWLGQVTAQLENAGLRPVFVMTPLNTPLVRSFARLYSADSVLHYLETVRAAVRAQLDETQAAVIDLTDDVPPECFFDLLHVNACGDDLIARTLAERLDLGTGLELEARHP